MKQPIVVVKYGSTSVTNEYGMDHARLDEHAERLARVARDYRLIVVSSGSVAVGECILRESRANQETKPSLPSIATLGSGRAFTAWQAAFDKHNLLSGQVLLTHRELDDPKEASILQQTLKGNLKHDIISVANENDALSDEELAKLAYGGDNDGLASRLAKIVKAQRLVLLTDREGLFDTHGDLVERLDTSASDREYALSLVGGNNQQGIGRGGMESKLLAAFDAADMGITAHIASAEQPLREIFSGAEGTQIIAKAS